ncbi:MAG TPA: arylamine N-acetyltransferase [bacterium]|jgi:arylamine N-acetyltransferase
MLPAHPPAAQDLFDRYLSLLGVTRRAPGYAALTELVRAHLRRVPFENVSKLFYKKRYGWRGFPDLDRFLAGIEAFHFGGTCYANNGHFHSLLRHLGYDVTLCGADMSAPDVHVVSLVRTEGREFLVDVGYGAPFLDPLPRDLPADVVIIHGEDRYVLAPQDAAGRSRLTLRRRGELRHGYTVNPAPRAIADFSAVIADSFCPDATFMNGVLIATYTPGGSRVLHNLESLEMAGGQTIRRTLTGPEAVAEEAERLFAIPRAVVAEALTEIPAFRDVWE